MNSLKKSQTFIEAQSSGSRVGQRRALLGSLSGWPVSLRVGALIVGLILISVAFAPWITHFDPTELGAASLSPPQVAHLMGTDDLGRDVFARVLYGGRITLVVGLFSALISVGLGLSIGVVAGFSGGYVDELLMRFTEAFQILPRLLVAIVVVTMIGGSLGNVILTIGFLSWPPTARIIRGQTLVLHHEDFVSAAILSGASYMRLIIRQILPNVFPLLFVSASTQVALAILSEAALSFLGLGDPTSPSWGQMLQQSQGFLRAAWWMSVFPGLALALLILGLNLLGDGLGSKIGGTRR